MDATMASWKRIPPKTRGEVCKLLDLMLQYNDLLNPHGYAEDLSPNEQSVEAIVGMIRTDIPAMVAVANKDSANYMAMWQRITGDGDEVLPCISKPSNQPRSSVSTNGDSDDDDDDDNNDDDGDDNGDDDGDDDDTDRAAAEPPPVSRLDNSPFMLKANDKRVLVLPFSTILTGAQFPDSKG